MSNNKSLSIMEFKHAARGALMEAELNGLRGRDDTEMADTLWKYFDVLEKIATSASQPPQEPLQGEVVDHE